MHRSMILGINDAIIFVFQEPFYQPDKI